MLTCLVERALPGADHRLVARPRREDVAAEAEEVGVDGVAGEPELVEDAVSGGQFYNTLFTLILKIVRNRALALN